MKVDNIAHDVEILKIRTSPLEEKKTTPVNVIQLQINENIRMLAKLQDRWAREKQEQERVKNLPTDITLANLHVVEDLKTFSIPHTPSPNNGHVNGKVEASTLGQESPTYSDFVKDRISLDNSTTTLIKGSELDFNNCNLSEVIEFLQKMAKDPHTSSLNIAFTGHITNALSKLGKKNLA